MMKMRSYQTIVLLLAKYSKHFTGDELIEKVAEKYRHVDEYKLRLICKDLDVLDYEDDIDFNRLSELMEMIENE